MIFEEGYLLGLIVSLIVCMLLVLAMKFGNKKLEVKINNIIKELPEENIEKIKNYNFCNYEENSNFFKGLSIIYKIVNEHDSVIVELLFFDSFNLKYEVCSINIGRDVFVSKNLKVGQVVYTVHNKRREVWLKVNKIL